MSEESDTEMLMDCEASKAAASDTAFTRKDRKAKKRASQNLELINNLFADGDEGEDEDANDWKFAIDNEVDAQHEAKRLAERKRMLICKKLGVKKLGDLMEQKSLVDMVLEKRSRGETIVPVIKDEELNGTRGIPTKEKVGYRCVPYGTASTTELACLRVDLEHVDAEIMRLENFIDTYPKQIMEELRECKKVAFAKAAQKFTHSSEEMQQKKEVIPPKGAIPVDEKSLKKFYDIEMVTTNPVSPPFMSPRSQYLSTEFMSPSSQYMSPEFTSPKSEFLSPSQSEVSRRQITTATSPQSSEFVSFASSDVQKTEEENQC